MTFGKCYPNLSSETQFSKPPKVRNNSSKKTATTYCCHRHQSLLCTPSTIIDLALHIKLSRTQLKYSKFDRVQEAFDGMKKAIALTFNMHPLPSYICNGKARQR